MSIMDNIIPKMVYQAETNECALACISMLAETQGINAPLETLRESFPASAHGTALSTMCDILSELAILPVRWLSICMNSPKSLYPPFCTTVRAIMFCWPIVRGATCV